MKSLPGGGIGCKAGVLVPAVSVCIETSVLNGVLVTSEGTIHAAFPLHYGAPGSAALEVTAP